MASIEEKTQHVIFLMLENRSFDQLLGTLEHPKHFERLPDGAHNFDRNGQRFDAFLAPDRLFRADPSHGHEEVMEQIYGERRPRWPYHATNAGFVKVHEDRLRRKGVDPRHRGEVMAFYDPARMMPVLSALATKYVLYDHWFCSMPGPTWPNRHFTHAGTSFGMAGNNILRAPSAGPTIFGRLLAAKRDWVVYADGMTTTWFFDDAWRPTTRDRFKHTDLLFDDIAADQLPDYAFIDPDHFGSNSYSQHPSRNRRNDRDFLDCEQFIERLYRTLVANPEVFKKTVLVITYDEHGGLYDHVAPPELPSPDNHHAGQFRFNVAGVRVPAILVSPWAPEGHVDQHVYDHTSIINTLRHRFAPTKPRLTERDGNARRLWEEETVLGLSVPFIDRLVPPPPSDLAEAGDIGTAAFEADQPLDDDERDYDALVRYVDRKLQEEELGAPLSSIAAEAVAAAERPARTRRELEADVERVAARFRETAPRNVRLRTPEGFTIVNPTTSQFESVVGRAVAMNARVWVQDSEHRGSSFEPSSDMTREEAVNRFTEDWQRKR